MNTLRILLSERREILHEMREGGIKRRSCFNGGHSPESYRLNARLFALETEIKNERSKGNTQHDCRTIES